MYLLTMFLILVCKVPDMLGHLRPCMFVHQGLGLCVYRRRRCLRRHDRPQVVRRMHGGSNAPVGTGWSAAAQAIGKRALDLHHHGHAASSSAGYFWSTPSMAATCTPWAATSTAAKLLRHQRQEVSRFMAGMFAAVFIAIGGIVVCSRNSAAQINGCDSYLMQLPGRRVRRSFRGRR